MKNFSEDINSILEISTNISRQYNHSVVNTAHLFLGLIKKLKIESTTGENTSFYEDIFNKLKDIIHKYSHDEKVSFKTAFEDIFPKAESPKNGFTNNVEIDSDVKDLFKKLKEASLKENREMEITDFIYMLIGEKGYKCAVVMSSVFIGGEYDSFVADILKTFRKPILSTVKELDELPELTNINKFVVDKKPTIVGMENTVKQLELMLCGRSIHNAALVGPAGVGKTTAVYELAKRINEHSICSLLDNKIIYELSLSNVVAGTKYRGDFEQKMQNLLDILIEHPEVILFVDEAHTMVKTGDNDGGQTAANIMKPYLTRGDIQLIIATTDEEWQKNIEPEKAFSRRFRKIAINEPTREETKIILAGLLDTNKDFFKREGNIELLDDVINLADQYSLNMKNPAKSINILEMAFACSRVFKESEKEVTNQDIIDAIKIQFDLTISKTRVSDTMKDLRDYIVGQDDVLDKIERHLKYIDCGLTDSDKPLASLMFCGSTGTGKTEVAKRIAKRFFGSEKNLIKINGGEYGSEMDVSKLIGSAPGYVGSDDDSGLVAQVKQNPNSLVLFDEVEKMHPKALDVLLNILDSGEMTDNHKNRVSFKNTIIIFTSNYGYSADDFKENLFGVSSKPDESKILDRIEHSEFFRPEFINRLDEIIVFNSLTKEVANTLIDRYLDEYNKRSNLTIKFTDSEYSDICKDSNIEMYGARSLKKSVKKFIINKFNEILKSKTLVNA